MDISIDSDNICEGCLSKDRGVTSHSDELLRLYQQLLGIKSNIKKINVCWECRGLLIKISRFKDQISKAHDAILNWLEKRSLSKLKLSQCLKVDCSSVNEESTDFKHVTFIKTEDIFQCNLSQNGQDMSQNGQDMSQNGQDMSQNEQDMSQNGQDMSQNGVDALQCGDVMSKKLYSSEDEVKVDVFSHNNVERDFDYVEAFDNDYENLNLDEKNVKTVEEFDESDDEPLGNKKEKKHKEKRQKREGKRREKAPGVVNNARVLRKMQQLNVSSDLLEMVVLSWDEVESERQSNLASEKFTRHVHKCHQCALGFNHRCKLEEHMKKHQPSAGAAECEVCHIFCKDQQALCSHRRRHRVRWRCRLCGGAWSRASVAADHVHRAHAAPPPTHACAVCAHAAPTLGQLRNHMKKCHSEQLKCELCGKMFRDRTSLRTHLFIHRGEKEYSCPTCNKQFLFKKAMEIHQVTHESPANLYCHECDMTFKNQMSFNQHMKYNLKHIDPARLKYACGACGKRFAKAARLEEHNLAVHLKLAPIGCPAPGCRFACASRAALRTHRRAAHGPVRRRRDHVCHVCGKAYTTKKSLAGHLRAHAGERPFRCAACPAAFGYEAALYNHNKLVHLKHKVNRSRAQANAAWVVVDVPNVQ